MLRFLQALNGSFVVKFLLVLIGLSFIGWEFGTGFTRAPGGTVLTVNDQELNTRAFQRDVESRLSQVREQMGDAYSPELLARFNVIDSLLQGKITELLLLDFARGQNLSVAPEALAKAISEIPAFQDGLGGFSTAQYKIALQNAGFTVPQFEQAMAGDMVIQQVRSPFENITFTNTEEAERLARVISESRTVRVLRVIKEDVPAPSEPSQQDLRTIYEDMQSVLKTPERRTFKLLDFQMADFIPQVAVTDEEIKNYYQEYRDTFGEPEGRGVKHILVKDIETAQEVLDKLEAGTPFANVAEEYSKDSMTAEKGGDLGVIYPGDMLPAFDDAAFALEVGTISAPVQTPFGVHIIKVTEIVSGDRKSLADVKDEIRRLLRQEKALNLKYDTVEEADEMLAAGASIEDVARTLEVSYETFTVNANGMTPEGTPALIPGGAENILDQVFTMDENIPSTPIDMGQYAQGFVEVTEIIPARQQEFDEVQEELKQAYEKEMYERAILAKATKILTARLQGQNFEALAKEYKLEAPIQTFVDITRGEKAKTPLINEAVQQELVSMSAGDVMEQVIPTKMGAAVYEVTAVEPGAPSEEDIAKAQTVLSQNLAGDLFQQFITHLQNEAKIEINQDQLAVIKERVLPTN